MQLAASKQSNIFGTRHAAIHHNRGAGREAPTSGKAIEHSLERGDILRIAGKHLVANGKAFSPDHETDDHLFAVRATITRMTALGLGIGFRQALKIGRGQIVEIDGWIEIEETAFALDQRRLDGAAMWVEGVENTIQRMLPKVVEIALENISQRGAPDPGRHGIL